MTTARLVNPYQLFKDVTGEDLANGTITVYLNKTTTLANVWADADATIPQANPYTLNGLGQVEGDLWFTDVVTILVKNSLGTTQWQVDDVNTQQDADDLLTSLVPKGGSFFYSEVIASGVVLSVGEVVRGDATGNNFRYNGGPVVNPESDTPYDQDTGLSNSGAWTDITIASAPVKESDIINLQDQINDIDPELNVDNYITGLITQNAPDADHDIEFGIGNAQDSTNTERLKLTSSIIKQIDAVWSEGTNSGGFPSTVNGGVVQPDTWYRTFIIGKLDGTIDAGFDSSGNSDAAALFNDATGYTLYRQVGWVRTDASANILGFVQYDNYFEWKTPVESLNGNNLGTNVVVTVQAAPNTTSKIRFGGRNESAVTARYYISLPASYTVPTLSDGVCDIRTEAGSEAGDVIKDVFADG